MQNSNQDTVLSREQAMAVLQKINKEPVQTLEQWQDSYYTILDSLPFIGSTIEPEGHVYNINIDWIPGDLRPMVYIVASLVGEYPHPPKWVINTYSKKGLKCFLEDFSRTFVSNKYPKEYARGGSLRWTDGVKVVGHGRSSIKIDLLNRPQHLQTVSASKTRPVMATVEPLVPLALSQRILGVKPSSQPTSVAPASSEDSPAKRAARTRAANKANSIPLNIRTKVAEIIKENLSKNKIYLNTRDYDLLDALHKQENININTVGRIATQAKTTLHQIVQQIGFIEPSKSKIEPVTTKEHKPKLRDAIVNLLQTIGHPLRVIEIAEKLKETGISTATVHNLMCQAGKILNKDPIFEKIDIGIFFLNNVQYTERTEEPEPKERIKSAPAPTQPAPDGYKYIEAQYLQPGNRINMWGTELKVVTVKTRRARTSVTYEDREIDYCTTDQLLVKEQT